MGEENLRGDEWASLNGMSRSGVSSSRSHGMKQCHRRPALEASFTLSLVIFVFSYRQSMFTQLSQRDEGKACDFSFSLDSMTQSHEGSNAPSKYLRISGQSQDSLSPPSTGHENSSASAGPDVETRTETRYAKLGGILSQINDRAPHKPSIRDMGHKVSSPIMCFGGCLMRDC